MSLLVPDSGLLFWMLLSFGIVFFVLAILVGVISIYLK